MMDISKNENTFRVQGRDTPVPVGAVGEYAGHARRLSDDCKASETEVDPRPPLSEPIPGKKNISCNLCNNLRKKIKKLLASWKDIPDWNLDPNLALINAYMKNFEEILMEGKEDSNSQPTSSQLSQFDSDEKENGQSNIDDMKEEELNKSLTSDKKTVQNSSKTLNINTLHFAIRQNLILMKHIIEHIWESNEFIYDCIKNIHIVTKLWRDDNMIRKQLQKMNILTNDMTHTCKQLEKTIAVDYQTNNVFTCKRSDWPTDSSLASKKLDVGYVACQTSDPKLKVVDKVNQTAFTSNKFSKIPKRKETTPIKMSEKKKDESKVLHSKEAGNDATPKKSDQEQQSCSTDLKQDKISVMQSTLDKKCVEVSRSRKEKMTQKTIKKSAIRYKNEAVIVKVRKDSDFKSTYKEITDKAKKILHNVHNIRKTRDGHVLFELNKGVASYKFAEVLKYLFESPIQVDTLRPFVTLEIYNLDPLLEEEEILEIITTLINIEDSRKLNIRNLKVTSTGTQKASLEVPVNSILKNIDGCRFRAGINYAKVKVLPNVMRCYKCHDFGHLSRNCKLLDNEHERCRKCGSIGHSIFQCNKEASCFLCKEDGITGLMTKHIAGSRVCLYYKALIRTTKAAMFQNDTDICPLAKQ